MVVFCASGVVEGERLAVVGVVGVGLVDGSGEGSVGGGRVVLVGESRVGSVDVGLGGEFGSG